MTRLGQPAEGAQSLCQQRWLFGSLHWIRTPISISSVEIGSLFRGVEFKISLDRRSRQSWFEAGQKGHDTVTGQRNSHGRPKGTTDFSAQKTPQIATVVALQLFLAGSESSQSYGLDLYRSKP